MFSDRTKPALSGTEIIPDEAVVDAPFTNNHSTRFHGFNLDKTTGMHMWRRDYSQLPTWRDYTDPGDFQLFKTYNKKTASGTYEEWRETTSGVWDSDFTFSWWGRLMSVEGSSSLNFTISGYGTQALHLWKYTFRPLQISYSLDAAENDLYPILNVHGTGYPYPTEYTADNDPISNSNTKKYYFAQIFDKGASPNWNYGSAYTNVESAAGMAEALGFNTNDTSAADLWDPWRHFVFTKVGANYFMYFEGVLAKTLTVGSRDGRLGQDIYDIVGDTFYLDLGGNWPSNAYYSYPHSSCSPYAVTTARYRNPILQDEFAIFDKGVNAADVALLYNNGMANDVSQITFNSDGNLYRDHIWAYYRL